MDQEVICIKSDGKSSGVVRTYLTGPMRITFPRYGFGRGAAGRTVEHRVMKRIWGI